MKKLFVFAAMLVLGTASLSAQNGGAKDEANAKNVFTHVKELGRSSVKDQANSGTCWSYSGQGFLEEELIRMGKSQFDLSEMFVVSHSYKDKGRKYVRMDGHMNYEQGGSFYDVLYVLKHYGAVPRSAMMGLNYGTTKNQHNELAASSKAYLQAILKKPNGTLSTAWPVAFEGIIDAYLGKAPEKFTFNGKEYTPKTYAAATGLNADDYVSLTSYTHHPFYSKFALEIPDNWRASESYNLPIDELMRTIEHSIEKGYTFAWGADVSEVGFTRDGIAVLADVEEIETRGSDQDRWVGLSRADKQAEVRRSIYRADVPEIDPTQEYRQKCFDNATLTDDHGMTIYGTATNQTGRKFFLMKNSWGETGDYKGIWYVSYNYVKGRTMNIVLHKDAIPADIAKKLGLKK